MKRIKTVKNVEFRVENDSHRYNSCGDFGGSKQSAIEELHRQLGDRKRARLIKIETTTIKTDITNEVIK